MQRTREEPIALFYNGRFLTLSRKRARVSSILVEGGRISATGTDAEVRRAAPRGAERIDLRRRHVVPGFNDCHTHFIQMGVDSMSIDLSHTQSLDDALARIREGSENVAPGRWVVATGWRESAWPDGRFITRRDLDECCPAGPAVAYRICGHLCSVNSKALSELCIDSRTPGADVDRQGRLTGVLRESAVSACRSATEPDRKGRLRGLELATRRAHELGVTSVTDNGSTEDMATYMTALNAGRLDVRVCFNMPSTELDPLLSTRITTGLGNSWLRLGGLKIFCDGALGARTAALSKDYSDDPGNRGMFVHGRKELDELTARASAAGMQLAVHAIGDAGIGVAVDSISKALKAAPRKDHRHRIEHLELPSRTHIRRIAGLGMVASMQPNFVGEWGGANGMYVSRIGPSRTARNNPFREVLDAGVRLAFGSDCMPFSPQYGILSAVGAQFPSQRITPVEALAAYTRDPAYATFEERDKGTLEEGKLADFAVLSGDPLKESILGTLRVDMTVVGGRVAYSRRSAAKGHQVTASH